MKSCSPHLAAVTSAVSSGGSVSPDSQDCPDAGTVRDARAERGLPAASASALLSMGHNSSLTNGEVHCGTDRLNASFEGRPPADYPGAEQLHQWKDQRAASWQAKAKHLLTVPSHDVVVRRDASCVGITLPRMPQVQGRLKVWTEGARADFSGIPNLNPKQLASNFAPGKAGGSKRGNVTGFSDKSRRRLQRNLATMKVAEVAYTMALTLPGCDVECFEHSFVMEAAKKLFRRLSVTQRFTGVSGFWKREIQKRGALHYHLLLYGLEDDGRRAEFQAWMVAQWCSLFASSITAEQREHHRWWHARAENMQLVRNFSGYFSKYLGKDEDAAGGVAGRWWGSFNKRLLPKSPRADAAIQGKETVMLHRLARKLREKKMDAGKQRMLEKRMAKNGFKITEMDLFRLRSGYDIHGHRNPRSAALYLACYLHSCKMEGQHPGKFRLRGKVPKTASIVLCGAAAPAFAAKALDFVNRSLGSTLELKEVPNPQDFTPDPLKPVPLGRIPRNTERVRQQSDFLGEMRIERMRQMQAVHMDHDYDSSPRRTANRKNGANKRLATWA